MRGATCAIFMMTFTPPADYERVHRSKVPLLSGRVGLIEIILSRRSRNRSTCAASWSRMEASEASRLDKTPAKTE